MMTREPCKALSNFRKPCVPNANHQTCGTYRCIYCNGFTDSLVTKPTKRTA